MIIDRGWIHPDDRYINVSLDLISAIGHVPALVIARIAFRTTGRWNGVIEVDALAWWRASLDELADDLSMSKRQMQRILATLVEDGTIVRAKHAIGDNPVKDHTFSYRVNYGEVPDPDEVDPVGAPDDANMSTSTDGDDVDNLSTTAPMLPNGTETVTEREYRPSLKEVKKSLNAHTREGSGLFELFVAEYPLEIGEPDLEGVRLAWRTAAARGARYEELVEKARRYREHLIEHPPESPKYVRKPRNWLADGDWKHENGVAEPKLKASAAPAETAPKMTRLQRLQARTAELEAQERERYRESD